MDTTSLQSTLMWLGTTLGFIVAVALIILLTVQVLRDAYHSPVPVMYSRRTKRVTMVLLAAFGLGLLLRIIQIQGLTRP